MALSVSNSGPSGSTGSSAATISISAAAGDVIALFAGLDGSTGSAVVTTVSGAGLTWVKRTAITPFSVAGQSLGLEEWYAVAGSLVSAQTITVNTSLTSGQTIDLQYIATSGADTTTPFDTNGALPNLQSSQSGSPANGTISTSSANTILLSAIIGLGISSGNEPSGWTGTGSTETLSFAAYDIVSSAQSSTSVSWGSGGFANWGMICDAVQAAGAAGGQPFTKRWGGMKFSAQGQHMQGMKRWRRPPNRRQSGLLLPERILPQRKLVRAA